MNEAQALARVHAHLDALTHSPDGRPVGSAANHAAEAYIAGVLIGAGYEVEQQRFDSVEWRLDSVELWAGDALLPVRANPYSPPCDVTAPFLSIKSIDELERAKLSGRIALLHGELTAEPLFPKNYPFFAVEEHRRILELLEAKRPSAVIAVSRMAHLPAPLVEDGDFTLPSVTVATGVGDILLTSGESPLTLRLRSAARPGHGANVIGRLAAAARDKLVICAHFDTKPGTPGALDNAAGVTTTLTLAERLATARPGTNLEIVAFNGEDHYAAPGEVAYLAACDGEFGRIALLINIDGVGLKDQPATVAFFGCPDEWTAKVRAEMSRQTRLEESEPWPEGDHTPFVIRGVPCIALTSGGIHALIDEVIHTPNDTLDLVELPQLAAIVDFLATLLKQIGLPPKPAT